MEPETIAFQLKHELMSVTPSNWDGVGRKISQEIVGALLRELEGLPSPEGRLFGEIRDAAKQESFRRGA